MARIDGKLTAAGEVSIEMAELVRLFAASSKRIEGDRQLAIACYLSASDGWRDAGQSLKGAFAAGARARSLTGKKEG